jgi:predicted Ser/Thr protein kinase
MTPERWSQVKLTLDRVLDRPSAERRRFLEDTCGDDEELLREVENLLEAHDLPETLVDHRAGAVLKGRYRLREKLGSGGVGVVYRADDLNLSSRPVVVKFLHEDFQRDHARRRKFRQEVEALARLDHPNIVGAFDADETKDGTLFLVMQYVEGRTLRQMLNDGGPLPFTAVAALARQIGDALKYAHDNGILHRDLKPENIMLQSQGRRRENIKLIDFGVARVEQSEIPPETGLMTFAGTPGYMAPEHLSGKPTAASDIFSFGVIIYEALTGRRPFSYGSLFQLRDLQRKGVPRGGIRQLRPKMPARAEELIRKALSYEPLMRPSDAHEFGHALAAELETLTPSLNRRLWIAGGAALALAGLASVLTQQSTQPRARRRDGNVLAEKTGAADPLQQGFEAYLDVQGAPVRNELKTGFDRWRMWSKEAGAYIRPLTDEEKREALERGWKISLRGYPLAGNVHAVVDFQGAGPRYDVSYRLEDGRAFVILCTAHEPLFEGLRENLNVATSHLFELVYDPRSQTCDLIVDGVPRIRGYKGHTQQQTPRGFFFGVSVYKSDRAEAIVDLARFELL